MENLEFEIENSEIDLEKSGLVWEILSLTCKTYKQVRLLSSQFLLAFEMNKCKNKNEEII